jgi:phosphopantothenoylcysteine decarboxylase/phosphopantothenate--cysteine ligase
MWQNPATMEAVEKLRKKSCIVLDPEEGQLASLHEGEGRLPKIIDIMNGIRNLFEMPLPLAGKTILVTAGPTREAIDPVRFISNRSSGKMGYALAEKARDMGASVILISGPVSLSPIPEIEMIYVETAEEMAVSIQANCNDADYLFMVAAVADYSPVNPADQKIKRTSENKSIELKPALDILKSIKGKTKGKVIAFALETHDGESEAQRKLVEKGADFIVLNYANEEGAGFESSTNRVTIFSKSGNQIELKKDRKDRIAQKIIEYILNN